ncbi:AraC family transcriptional regulator [Paludicola sp. MB14-C6]|uniref:helix-turn-helix domain-containing protein n=1 Tax=Paludihabitans sp. MB14-C6 TaxID=3070656 RepID=UPI0027DE63DE|nr:AraC family transcriptional regulator [Paludicola sp. MB14-C6]WMJ24115.1 AraC family transcriptional regulator [Paludicola sp. MB14-C6]
MQNQSSSKYSVRYSPYSDFNNQDRLPYHLEHCLLPYLIEELHYHDGIELGYCSSGCGVFIIGKEIISFQAPCVTIIYPKQFHKAKSTGSSYSDWQFASFSPQMPLSHLNFIGPVLQAPDCSQSIYYQNNILFTLIKELIIELQNKEMDYLKSATGLLKSILVKHSRVTSNHSNNPNSASILTRIGPILNYISHNYKQSLSVNEIASSFHISPATLRRWFSDSIHSSPLQYLHKVRTTTASSLLINTDLSVLEVAIEVGYQSQSSFQRQFQRQFHCSPTQYITQNRNQKAK